MTPQYPKQTGTDRVPASSGSEMASISLSPRQVGLTLGSIITFFILAALAGQVARWFFGADDAASLMRWIDVEGEKNPPALFAGLQLLLAAAVAWITARCDSVQSRKRGWFVLSLGMAWMAFDEVFFMHERLIEPTKAIIGTENLGPLTYAWVVPAIIIVAAFAVYFAGFLRRLPAPVRNRLLLAGGVFVGGAIGLEMVGGWYWSTQGNDFTQSLIVIVEEALEFSGICLFIVATLRFVENHVGPIKLAVSSDR